MKKALIICCTICSFLLTEAQTTSIHPSDSLFIRFLWKNIEYPDKESDDTVACVLLARIKINNNNQIDTFYTTANNAFGREVERLMTKARISNIKINVRNEWIIVPFVFIPELDCNSGPDDKRMNPYTELSLWKQTESSIPCYFFKPIIIQAYRPVR